MELVLLSLWFALRALGPSFIWDARATSLNVKRMLYWFVTRDISRHSRGQLPGPKRFQMPLAAAPCLLAHGPFREGVIRVREVTATGKGHWSYSVLHKQPLRREGECAKLMGRRETCRLLRTRAARNLFSASSCSPAFRNLTASLYRDAVLCSRLLDCVRVKSAIAAMNALSLFSRLGTRATGWVRRGKKKKKKPYWGQLQFRLFSLSTQKSIS